MLIGNKDRLAFDWNVIESGGVRYVEFRLWARGVEVGRYEDYELLSSVCSCLRQYLSSASERFLSDLDDSPPEDVLTRVFGMMSTVPAGDARPWLRVRQAGYQPDEYREHGRLRRVFHLDDVIGSPFRDKFNVMVMNLSSGPGQRLIWRNLETTKVGEVRLGDHEFDQLAEQFLTAACSD